MPAQQLAKSGHAFASGLLLVSCLDALARVIFPGKGPAERFKKYILTELESFKQRKQIVQHLWDNFRNGLVHEARIKNGGQFSLDIPDTVEYSPPILLLNPILLSSEVSDALTKLIARLNSEPGFRKRLISQIREDFSFELQNHI